MEKLSDIEEELHQWIYIRNKFLIGLPRLETEIESLKNELYVDWLKSFNGYFSDSDDEDDDEVEDADDEDETESEEYTVSEESDNIDDECSSSSDSDESVAADNHKDLDDFLLEIGLDFVKDG